MSVSPEDIFETLRKLRMDLTNAQGKLSDVQRYLAALNIEENHQPLDPAERLRREIRNGAIRDGHDLTVALRALADKHVTLDRETIAALRVAVGDDDQAMEQPQAMENGS